MMSEGRTKEQQATKALQNRAAEQARTQLDSIIELVTAFRTKREANEDCDDEEQAIQEDPLCVEVRSAWHAPGDNADVGEYRILLCTGGPAVQIVGELNEYHEPDTAEIQFQDWFTLWETMPTDEVEEKAMLDYAQCFYFDE